MGQRGLWRGRQRKQGKRVTCGVGGGFKGSEIESRRHNSGQWVPHVYVSRVVLSRQWQARVRATPENVAPQPPNHRRLRCTVYKQLHVNLAVLHCSLLNTSLLSIINVSCLIYFYLVSSK